MGETTVGHVAGEVVRALYGAGYMESTIGQYRKSIRALERLFLVKSVFRVSSLIFFGFRHEECRPVVCFTGCPSCRT
ncbi:hypothetical protein GBI34_10070 [Bifidobacterium longum]|nr:hypothetical protein GBI47_10130 [Bifidobacterium longum]KAB7085984.1 hypothetical protein GBJ14_11530 [Bifidobacterium longum]KAB7099384.1 hypothetical protein GBI34_10070 [Bifidobacterium longum]KAB7111580.1 hypothetical protein GBI58_06820 [Bifidobacterium longum]KAB7116106.1 hypothetical protein GBI36_08450 [Bifidobacterium longum]